MTIIKKNMLYCEIFEEANFKENIKNFRQVEAYDDDDNIMITRSKTKDSWKRRLSSKNKDKRTSFFKVTQPTKKMY
jgi:hypothetical protein